MTTTRSSAPAWTAPVLVLLLVLCSAMAVTRGTLDFFDDARAGMLFNDMALRLLDGRFDVSPEVIKDEAFVHAGRSYSYYGIWPALLRLPLSPFLDLAHIQVSRLSCFLAIMLALFAQFRAVHFAVQVVETQEQRLALSLPFLFAVALSGPGTYLAPRPLMYHESILWAWAWAAVFVAAATRGLLLSKGRFSGGTLAVMAAAAGLCMSTRSSTGLGLYVALALVLVLEATRRWRGDGRGVAGLSGLLPPGLIAAGFALLVLAVNFARWGDAFNFGDMRLQTLMQDLPHRLAVIADYGAFSMHRLWLGLGYYLVPLWAVIRDGQLLFAERSHELYWAVEGPPASQILMEPYFIAMAGLGLWALRRRGVVDRPAALAVTAGLAVPAMLIVLFLYLAFRYRAEFSPLLLLLGLIGLHAQAHRAGPRGTVRQGVWWLLLGVQISATQIWAFLYKIAPLGPPIDVAADGWVTYYLRLWLTVAQGDAAP